MDLGPPARARLRRVALEVPATTMAIVVAAVLAWIGSILATAPDARRPASALALLTWADACPRCGTVEILASLQPQGGPRAPLYRLSIRMADGSLRDFMRVLPLPPGARVTVKGEDVLPAS